VVAAGLFGAAPAVAAAVAPRVDLRVLVVDDGGVGVGAIAGQLAVEGVPFTRVSLADPARPTITSAFLAGANEARFEAVVLPDAVGGTLPAAELSALTSYEAQFGIRQVDAYDWANPTVGLNYAASPGFIGDLTGRTATVTAAGLADGFAYSTGTVPLGSGSYSYLATPAGTGVMPAGGSFTPLVTATIPGTTTAGSLLGVYSAGGVEKLVITTSLASFESHFKVLAHGIVDWATRGVHLGHNRSYLTFHFDDAFGADARWDVTAKCTPGEDCQFGVPASTTDIRMTAADVSHLTAWQQASGYTVTLPFNGYYALNDANGAPLNGTDGLVNALVAAKDQFRWLSHGYQHIYQGCVQIFATGVPWSCTTPGGQAPAPDGSNITWTPLADVANEISNNIVTGQFLGLPFDPTEYLSGEHSGLKSLPQQPVDNPNYAAAVTANGLKVIGADASREPGARTVGSALTVPRHPVAVYYNVSTEAEEVSEYNWFYASAANGGSGSCALNPATTSCMASALDPATGFKRYILPSDAAYDLTFILANDPRPFYAHVSNLTGPDYLGLQLIDKILSIYRTSFAASAPLVNLSMTQASQVLTRQQDWAAAGMSAAPTATGYVQGGVVTISNPGAALTPVTVPMGTTQNGTGFGEAYAGELSGWVPGSTTLALPPTFTSSATASFTQGVAGSFTVTTSSPQGAPRITATALPAGVTLVDNGNGTATLAGTPATGTVGTYQVTLTAVRGFGQSTQVLHLVVGPPAATTGTGATGSGSTGTGSSGSGTSGSGTSGSGTSGSGTSGSGTSGSGTSGSGTSGSGTSGSTGATAGPRTAPVIVSVPTATAVSGNNFTFTVHVTGNPLPRITATGTLPAGLKFTDRGNGTATLAGTLPETTRGSYRLTFTATNAAGTVRQAFRLRIGQAPKITSAAPVTGTVGGVLSRSVVASGPGVTLQVTGKLPAGLSFRSNRGVGTLSGRPAQRTGGVYQVTVTASNAYGRSSRVLVITVRQPARVTSPRSASVSAGRPSTLLISTSGFPAATVTRVAGALPAGMSLRPAGHGTATLAGTPRFRGRFTVVLRAANGSSSATQALVITVR
jgi:hypothetical protein